MGSATGRTDRDAGGAARLNATDACRSNPRRRGVIPCYIGDGHPLLERLTAPIPELAATYWMIIHRDIRRAPCVRAVIDWMKALFAEQRDIIAGQSRNPEEGGVGRLARLDSGKRRFAEYAAIRWK